MARGKQDTGVLDLPELEVGEADVHLLGLSPLIFNRMALKARQSLLMPRPGRMTQAEKASHLKHDPLQEYRDSVSRIRPGESGPTRLVFPAPGFKGALATASLDLPGVTKSRINRLTWVTGTHAPIWGIPEMFLAVVRNSDAARTADIRTRAIVPRWAARVTIRFASNLIKAKEIATLCGASGLIVGIGDFRQEKGKGNFGQFEVVPEDDPRLLAVMAEGGMAAQDAALENPRAYDLDSEELFAWYIEERARRGTDQSRALRRSKDGGATVGTA